MTPQYETLEIEVNQQVAYVSLNRPDKANAMNAPMWAEIQAAMEWIDTTPEVRVGVIAGNGKNFCAGIDLGMFGDGFLSESGCDGRKREALRRKILNMQNQLSAIEACRKPIIAAIHGACVGGAIDMTSACDMRYSTRDARFSIKEIDIGMTADVGTLQRMPHLIGDGMMRELAYTGRFFDGEEAVKIGFVNRTYANHEDLMAGVRGIAEEIAAKSPLSIRGIKETILYTRDHSVADSLNFIATWNASMLVSDDLKKAMTANMMKQQPQFED